MTISNRHEKESSHILCHSNIFLNLGEFFSHFKINCGASKHGNINSVTKTNYGCAHQLQQIMLSERSSFKRLNNVWFHLYDILGNIKL